MSCPSEVLRRRRAWRRRQKLGRAALLLGSFLLVTACGSTVAVDAGRASNSEQAQLGITGSSPQAGDAHAPTSAAAGTVAGNAGGTANARSGGTSAAPPGGGTSTARAGGENLPTARAPVEIGIYVSENAQAFYQAIGASNQSVGNNKAQAQAVVNYVNHHGGLAGHPIIPVYAYLDATSNNTWASQEEAACATWTQDHHVIAAVSALNADQTMASCLDHHSVPLIVEDLTQHLARDFSAYPLVTPASIDANRLASIYIDQLSQQRFFAASTATPVKIGLLYFDTPGFNDVRIHALYPALAKIGQHVTDAVGFQRPQGLSDLGPLYTQIENAMLHFHADAITHIITMDEAGDFWGAGSLAAENQHYYPKWGLNSYDAPGVGESQAPADQAANAVGVGFDPLFDVDQQHQPPRNPTAKLCTSIMTAAGQATTSQQTLAVEWAYCDTLLLLQSATRGVSAPNLATAPLAERAILNGVDALGRSFLPANTFNAYFSAEQRDGAASVRRFGYTTNCNCFVYTSGLISVH